jgi:Domain of unknown function (DUF4389)
MYPVSYEADYKEEHNRWTTGFRLILAIPWVIVFYIFAIAAVIVTIISWFAILIIGRNPNWAQEFNSGFLRFYVRFASWLGLQTDEWPPFGFGEEATYPVRMSIVLPERQSRLKVLFRLILVIPALIVAYMMALIQGGAALVSWVAIVFRGYKPRGAHDAFNWAFNYGLRLYAYWGVPIYYGLPVGGLLVDDYPPIGEEGPRRKAEKKALASSGGGAAPAAEGAVGEQQPPPPAQ